MISANGYLVDPVNFTGIPVSLVKDGLVLYTRHHSPGADRNLTLAEYIELGPDQDKQHLTVLDEAGYQALLLKYYRKTYFDVPAQVIDCVDYHDYLGMLPVLRMGNDDGMEYFISSEPVEEGIYRMCGVKNDIYLSRFVYYKDPDTWLKPCEFHNQQSEVSS
ncbi:hypothetical protein ACT3UJ_06305 [Halomonas sp. 86]|uniref:hypothetical protein n=1 Tax=unclassified Halomonas TaxID=2609666 RepID=UPI004033DF20